MPDMPTPDSATLPEGSTTSGGPAARPGPPPADTAALALSRADRVAITTPGNAEPRQLTTDQLMPTCMIYAMFAGLAVLAGTMLCWMGSALNTALHIFH